MQVIGITAEVTRGGGPAAVASNTEIRLKFQLEQQGEIALYVI